MSESIDLFGQPASLVILTLVVVVSLIAFIVLLRRRRAIDLIKIVENSESNGGGSQEALEEDDEDNPDPSIKAARGEKKNLKAEPIDDGLAVPDTLKSAADNKAWHERLRLGLTRTRQHLFGGLSSLFVGGGRVDEALLEKIHETLYRADIGMTTADLLVAGLRKRFRTGDDIPTWDAVRTTLVDEITSLLTFPVEEVKYPNAGPLVVLVVGVNGVGKTTSIGKLAAHYLGQEKSVLLAAGDTFRAAAIDQLQVWADRLGIGIIRQNPGSDPAAIAYDAVKAAIARKIDVLLIDTAGRLHSKKELMDELAKIKKVVGKDLPGAPHETWLVIDATTGQNALMQVSSFREVAEITGLIVTKLDGTAKGGVVIGATHESKLPIRYIGIGESASDLRPFSPKDFAESLF